jgi:hypothetical protein
MPHTHHNIIILPSNWFYEIANTTTNTNNNKLSSNGGTLWHEIVHILQRWYPAKFNDLYNRWNFVKVKYLDNFKDIIARNRKNPDGLDIMWIWKYPLKRLAYWFGALFKTTNPSSLTDVDYLVYEVYKINKVSYKIKETPPKLISSCEDHYKYFNLTVNHYHPNEIVAEYMSIWFKSICKLREAPTCEAFNIFVKWLDEELL